MKNYSILVLVIVFSAFLVGRYFTPTKIETKVEYRDREVQVDKVITEIKYKDGSSKIVTQEKIVEKEKDKIITKFDTKKWIVGGGFGTDFNSEKYINLDVSRKLFGDVYISLGTTSNISRQIGYVGFKILF